MINTGWITRACCIASLLCGSLMFAQAAAPSSKTAAPEATTHHKSAAKKSHKEHMRQMAYGRCKNQTMVGNAANYEKVDPCPSACQLGTPGQKKDFVIDVDDYIDNNNDPDTTCLRAGDTVTWQSPKGRNFKIKDIKTNGAQGHPFMGGLRSSYDSKANGNARETDKLEVRNSAIPDTGCFVFRPHVEVDTGNPGDHRYECYDPHIYTDCGDACAAAPDGAAKAVAPKSKNVTARKSKARKDEAEVPGGR